MDTKWVLLFFCTLVCDQLFIHTKLAVLADECGTRFTDFTSSAVLAQIVLKGVIKDFNPSSQHSQVRSANVTVGKVYKGMDVLKEFNRTMEEGDDVVVHHFGLENKDNCIAPANEESKGRDKVFFLRQTSHRGMLRLSAMPVNAPNGMDRRVRRSLCDTCVRPPLIKRLVCQDCAKEPTIKTMKSKKAKVGRRARLRCVARGKPTPTIRWARSNVPIVSGTGGITIRTTGASSILIFSPVSMSHRGMYKCIARNEAGQTEAVVTLNVTIKVKARQRYTVETAPDQVSCQNNPCLNGGSCIFSPSLNLRRCLCSPGFEGVQCENDESKSGPAEPNNENFNRVPVVASPDTSDRVNAANANQTSSTLSTTSTTSSSPSVTTSTATTTTITTTITTTARRFVPSPTPTVISRHFGHGRIDPRYPVSKKSTLKIIPCNEKKYCKNWGKCRFIRKLNKKFCKCRPGFVGARCESRG